MRVCLKEQKDLEFGAATNVLSSSLGCWWLGRRGRGREEGGGGQERGVKGEGRKVRRKGARGREGKGEEEEREGEEGKRRKRKIEELDKREAQ